jgi:hypothetical protein
MPTHHHPILPMVDCGTEMRRKVKTLILHQHLEEETSRSVGARRIWERDMH